MLINKLLTRKGWRVVASSMLTAAGIGLVCLFIIQNGCRRYPARRYVKTESFGHGNRPFTMVSGIGKYADQG